MRTLYLSILYSFMISAVNAQWFEHETTAMGTRIFIQLKADHATQADMVTQIVLEEIHRLDRLLSPYKTNSELSQVNLKAKKGETAVSSEFKYLIEQSLYYAELSQGAFDITFASIGHLYDYRAGIAPSDIDIQHRLPAINYQHLILKDRLLSFRHPEVKIDLGGIAKGYAIDRAIAILKSHRIQQASISAGGDSYYLGYHHSRPWHVGIQHPRDPSQVALMIPVENTAVSTSGDYERYFEQDNQRHHHLIHPQTGRSPSELVSVTVLGKQGIQTDALSTGLFILGLKKGLALANQLEDIDAVFIDANGQVHYSDQLTPPHANGET